MRIISGAIVALVALFSLSQPAAAQLVTATVVNTSSQRVSLDIRNADEQQVRVALNPGQSRVIDVAYEALRRDPDVARLARAGRIRVDLAGGIPAEVWQFSVATGGALSTTVVPSMPYTGQVVGVVADIATAGSGTGLIRSGTATVSATFSTASTGIVTANPNSLTTGVLTRGQPLIIRRPLNTVVLTVRLTVRPTSL